MKYGISLSIGRENDLRFKLTEDEIKKIKKSKKSVRYLATKFKVARQTIEYHKFPEVNAKMKEKNRKHKRPWNAHDNVTKQRRRDLTRETVRLYTRTQMKSHRRKQNV